MVFVHSNLSLMYEAKSIKYENIFYIEGQAGAFRPTALITPVPDSVNASLTSRGVRGRRNRMAVNRHGHCIAD